MMLSFSTKNRNDEPTYFIQKIWVGLIEVYGKPRVYQLWNEYLQQYWEKFGKAWDAPYKDVLPKIHTIREDKSDRWSTGKTIHMIVFNRTKNRFQFAPVQECRATQPIEVIPMSADVNEIMVKVDGRALSMREVERLALLDGFNDLFSFCEYFKNGITGKIIHWTDLIRY